MSSMSCFIVALGGRDVDGSCPKLGVAIRMSRAIQTSFTIFLPYSKGLTHNSQLWKDCHVPFGLAMAFPLLQWQLLVGIGSDNQVSNVSFLTGPTMRHATRNYHNIALCEPAGHAAFNSVAGRVGPIPKARLARRRGFLQRAAGHQHSGALDDVIS